MTKRFAQSLMFLAGVLAQDSDSAIPDTKKFKLTIWDNGDAAATFKRYASTYEEISTELYKYKQEVLPTLHPDAQKEVIFEIEEFFPESIHLLSYGHVALVEFPLTLTQDNND
jgi:hypothetical protein